MNKYLATMTAVMLLGASPIVHAQHSPPAVPEVTQIKIMEKVDVLLAGTQWQVKPLQQNSQQQQEQLPPKQPPKQQPPPKQPPKQGQYQQQPPPKQPPKQGQYQQQPPPKQPPKQGQYQQPPPQQQHQQMPPKQQPPLKQPPMQQQQPPMQHDEHQQMPPKQSQHFEYHHDWNHTDYQKLTWHKHHHHYKRYVSPFRWYDPWDFWYDRYHYSDFYFFGIVYDDDWDWLFPGFYTYRWRDYERNDHGFYYRGKRITELILVFDPYEGLVGVGFMYKGIFIFLRDDMEEYYFDDEPTLIIVARIFNW